MAEAFDGKTVLMTDGRGSIDYTVVIAPIEGGSGTRLGDGDAGNLSPDGRWASALRYSTGKCVVYPTGAGAPVEIATGIVVTVALALLLDLAAVFLGRLLLPWTTATGRSQRQVRTLVRDPEGAVT